MNRGYFLTLITFVCFFFNLNGPAALERGSERFVEFASGAQDQGVLVDMARNPSITDNFMFTDTRFVSAIPNTQFGNGAGHRYLTANVMNFNANFTRAAAKTDPRSPGFIFNSMDRLLTDPQFEMELGEGLKASELSVEQAGENAKRYLLPEIITPEVGYYQTADNQQSFESAYDNVLLGKAEEALFEGDRASATAEFNALSEDYKNISDKQTTASSFQKQGMLRSVKTAETFRDFFQMKAEVSKENLNHMPTKESLVNNCHSNTNGNENLFGVYDRSMPQEEVEFYSFERPNYSFDFCDTYVHTEENFLIQNRPVRDQLQTLVEDSTEMANGLDEVIQELKGRDLGVEQIADLLSNSEAWQKLRKRSEAYEECKKVDCLEPARKTLGKLVIYPGHKNHLPSYRKEFRNLLRQVRRNKSMPGNDSQLLQNVLAKLNSSKQKKKLKGGLKNKTQDSGIVSDEELEAYAKKRKPASIGSKVIYEGRKFPRGGGYFRGEDGVLRGPSGRPVQGYANKPGTSLWDIISRRYMLKMRDEL